MVTALTDDMRQTLAERVRRRVTGRGIPRHAIEAAVERVADALEHASATPSAARDASAPQAVLVAFSSDTHPDLTSRVRAAFAREQIPILATGSATAGRFTVTTLQLAAGAERRAEALAGAIGARYVVLRDETAAGNATA